MSHCVSSAKHPKKPLRGPVSQLVDNHGDNDDATNENLGVRIRNGQLAATAANYGDDQCTYHGSKNGPTTTAEAATTKDNCSNDFQFLPRSIAGISALYICKIKQSADCHKETGDGVNSDHSYRDIDAAKTSG